MLRNILAVVVGYLAMFMIVAGVFTVAYILMGDDRAFKEASYDVSILWVVVSVVVGLFASVVGGAACALISRRSAGAVQSLMVLVLVLGAISAAMAMMKEKPTGEDAVRAPETTSTEAMMNAQQPTWILIANPIIGAVGVMTGGMMVGAGGRKRIDAGQ